MVEKIEAYTYLDNLRESGVTNMFGAGSYMESEFGISKSEARELLTGWMEAYGKTWDGEKHEFVVEKATT